jgi:iron complex transport system ATP-binding protein
MLVLDGISLSLQGTEILRDLSFELTPGRLVAVLGVNGSGKSTLLRSINGLLPPRRGTVLVDRQPLADLSGREIARLIGYMPQKANGVACSVFDAVLLGRRPHFGWSEGERDLAVVERVLTIMGLDKLALRDTSELSGGELQKVLIARALVQEPQVLLLDEPINHLDIRNQLETMSLLRKITGEMDLVTITVLHDLSIALRFADYFLLIREGRLYACGGREVISPEVLREVFRMDAAIREIDGIPVVLPLSPCN